jgi:hypothetical protein
MGWKYVEPDPATGKVNVKKQCDDLFLAGASEGVYKVKKSTMIGKTYYAAVEPIQQFNKNTGHWEDIPKEERKTFPAIIFTKTANKPDYNFFYEIMDENLCPIAYDCPESILNLLSPTDNKLALKWRSGCREEVKKRKIRRKLRALPFGTTIRFNRGMETLVATKCPPDSSSTWSYWRTTTNTKIKNQYVPDDYTIL